MRSAWEPLLRRLAGTSANTSVSMRCGGAKSDMLRSFRGDACLLHDLRPLLRLVGDEAAELRRRHAHDCVALAFHALPGLIGFEQSFEFQAQFRDHRLRR